MTFNLVDGGRVDQRALRARVLDPGSQAKFRDLLYQTPSELVQNASLDIEAVGTILSLGFI